ncbi:hypothetical protein NIES2101_42580, partial [Calothrix sp. HK-06]
MLANLYLHEFDCWVLNSLSKQYSLRYVRYADDFVILLKQQDLIPLVYEEVSQKLRSIKLELHPVNQGKTRFVDIGKDSLEFVGFEFTLEHTRVKKDNILRFQKRILEKIAKEPHYNFPENPKYRFKNFIICVINKKITGRGETECLACGGVIGERVKSWMGFFMVITDVQQLREFDKWVRKEIGKHFYKKYGLRLQKSDFHNAHFATLEQEYYRLHKRKKCCCLKTDCSDVTTINKLTTHQNWSNNTYLQYLFYFVL